ncbi:hypothetical protein R6Q57_020736 [Mikania cordata]
MEHLIRARDLLNTSLHQSRQIDFELHKSSVTLAHIDQNFPTLETAIRDMASNCATLSIGDHVGRALPTVLAVLNVYRLVNELGTSVAAQSSSHLNLDLTLYISLIKRFKQALTLLTNTCKLAILWVQDVKQFLQHTTTIGVAHDQPYHLIVCKTLHLLKKVQETEKCCLLDQGILGVAFKVLEDEYENLLTQNSLPVQVPSSLFSSGDEESDESVSDALTQPVLPFHVANNLKAIISCFSTCNHQVDRCMAIYVKVRSTNFETSLQDLDLNYLEISLSEFDSIQDIEGYIDDWGRHLEFVVKHMLELEYTLCDHVFGQLDVIVWTDCFSRIALQSGIHRFIKFGNMITKAKKEAIKLFKLLDVFNTLNNLRHDFNRFFGGKECSEIQSQTRNLIKKVVNGTTEILHELSAQVQLQRLMDPPPDGSVPRLVNFVTEYCEELLDDDYRLVLDQILEIHCSWYNPNKKIVSVEEVYNIIKALELNLEAWARRYEDSALSCIFMMNTSCYLNKHLKGTRLGDLMGESWLKQHDDRVQYFTQIYLRESWGKIPAFLTNTDRITGFAEAFDREYRKQSRWVLCDDGLRWKICELIMESIVLVYNDLGLVEGGSSPSNKYAKYSSEGVENLVSSMFQPKNGSSDVIKCANLVDRIKSLVAGRFSPATVAA